MSKPEVSSTLSSLWRLLETKARGLLHDNNVISLAKKDLMLHCLTRLDEELRQKVKNHEAASVPQLVIDIATEEQVDGRFLVTNLDYENGVEPFAFQVKITPRTENNQGSPSVMLWVGQQGSPFIRDITTRVSRMDAAQTVVYDLTDLYPNDRVSGAIKLNTIAAGDNAPAAGQIEQRDFDSLS